MNRFRTKKKAKDGSDVGGRSGDSDAPVPKSKSTMTFRRGKKEPEPKLELDLANALPPSDDFRTSLLMSGLSARFSMLRDQDDPKSKIGKASDDSVLFPKRQSQLHNFGFQPSGLADIAEVSSIRSGPRPPFLSDDRVNSFHSMDGGYGTDDGGSMMGRAKPGEGNNLFGGRQKIYKIPVGAATLMNPPGEGQLKMGGRALYGDDVSQSAFQKLKEREREERLRLQREEEEREEAAHSIPARSNSPPLLGYNRNRETSSTTSSGPSFARSSTAATSVTSQFNGYSTPSPAIPQANSASFDRLLTKTKRLYETGLDRDLHSQQHSAMHRLENLARPRNARTPSPGVGSPITYENSDMSGFTNHQQHVRSASPPPTASKFSGFDFGTKPPPSLGSQKTYVAPPLSPPMSEGDEQPSLVIQPNDRGKATALGAFSKPIQQYNDKKYAQRQLQMLQGRDGRETPPLRRNSPPTAFAPDSSARPRAESNSTHSSARSASSSSGRSQLETRNRHFNPQMIRKEPPVAENPLPSSEPLDDNFSTATIKAEKISSPFDDVSSVPGIDYNGVEHVPFGPNSISPMHDKWAQIRRNAAETEKAKQFAPSNGVVHLANGNSANSPSNVKRPPESQHPANRPGNQRLWVDYTGESNFRANPTSQPVSTAEQMSEYTEPPVDSPTLGPGLSGLVRQHLRSESNESGTYGAPSSGSNGVYPSNPKSDTNAVYSTNGNPWENDSWDEPSSGQSNSIRHSPSFRPPPLNVPIPPISNAPARKAENLNTDVNSGKAAWEREIESRHQRAGSSETQKEREDFASELATRRKQVQENMRSFAEADNRSPNANHGMEWQKEANGTKTNTMGILKTKISRETLGNRPAAGNHSKAMKMLGIGHTTISSAPSPNAPDKLDDNMWKKEEEDMLRGVPKSPRVPPTTKSYRQARRDAQRDLEREVRIRHTKRMVPDSGDSDNSINAQNDMQQRQQRLREPSEERLEPAQESRAPSQESRNYVQQGNRSNSRPPSRSPRDRSSSDTSGRSKSRNGRYRDDLAKAMAEGHGSSAQGVFEDSSARRAPSRSPAPHVMNFQNSSVYGSPVINGSNRSRSNSKTGYFDNNLPGPIQTSIMDIGVSPRPSPITPFSVNPTPALVQHSPSPSISGANTPLGQGFPAHIGIPNNRKRSVNKADISEPTLLHKTSDIVTINLPHGVSLSNGSASAPPLPPMDPRRRQTRTQTMFEVFTGKHYNHPPTPQLPTSAGNYSDEMSTFSADEAEKKKPRQKLRKSSSEGGNLNVRARQAFDAAPNPAVPIFPVNYSPPSATIEGGMF